MVFGVVRGGSLKVDIMDVGEGRGMSPTSVQNDWHRGYLKVDIVAGRGQGA